MPDAKPDPLVVPKSLRSALVVGCGSIGRRHIRNMRRLGVRRILAFDPDERRLEYARTRFRCTPVRSMEAGLGAGPSFAVICTPPSTHSAAAQAALRRRIPCLVEKPLAHSLEEALRLRRTARASGAGLAVGYQLRRHPAVLWMKERLAEGSWGKLLYLRAQFGQYLPDWRPWQDYRRSYTARKSLGGGILLDASHEIDLALCLGGDIARVFCAARRLSRLDIDVEDTAELTVWFKSGSMGSLHVDMIRRAYDRSCQLTCEHGVAAWSYEEGVVREYSAGAGRWTTHRFPKDGNAPYLSELRRFIRNRNRSAADGLAGLEDGIRALRIVAAAKRSAASGRIEIVG